VFEATAAVKELTETTVAWGLAVQNSYWPILFSFSRQNAVHISYALKKIKLLNCNCNTSPLFKYHMIIMHWLLNHWLHLNQQDGQALLKV